MGRVYKAFDPDVERYVALKTIQAAALKKSELRRFKQEARAIGRMQHPNIVALYEYNETPNGLAFLAMEYADGKSFLTAIKERDRPWPIREALSAMENILAALHYAHMRGVIHRDIKPDNVMLLKSGDIKVTDFGIAHLDSSNLTHAGAILGTPSYMAPEMFGEFKASPVIDTYAAGIVLYELLTLKKPFTGSVASVIKKILTEEPEDPSILNPTVPDALAQTILKAISKNPDKRYHSAQDFAAALKTALKGSKIPLESPPLVKSPPQTPLAEKESSPLPTIDTDFKRVSIVLAHADSSVRARAKNILFDNGFRETKIAENLTEAHDLLLQYKPHLFICGTSFPDGNIHDFIAKIQNDAIDLNPFVAVMAKDISPTDMQEFFSSGADDILTLPLSTVTFLDHIVDLISRRKKLVVTDNYVGPDRRTIPPQEATLAEPLNEVIHSLLKKSGMADDTIDSEDADTLIHP